MIINFERVPVTLEHFEHIAFRRVSWCKCCIELQGLFTAHNGLFIALELAESIPLAAMRCCQAGFELNSTFIGFQRFLIVLDIKKVISPTVVGKFAIGYALYRTGLPYQ